MLESNSLNVCTHGARSLYSPCISISRRNYTNCGTQRGWIFRWRSNAVVPLLHRNAEKRDIAVCIGLYAIGRTIHLAGQRTGTPSTCEEKSAGQLIATIIELPRRLFSTRAFFNRQSLSSIYRIRSVNLLFYHLYLPPRTLYFIYAGFARYQSKGISV